MKLVINRCYGGWHLSENQQAILGAENEYAIANYRTDERLIASVEAGDTGGHFAQLEVVSIPDNAHYVIQDYDGYETVLYSSASIHSV